MSPHFRNALVVVSALGMLAACGQKPGQQGGFPIAEVSVVTVQPRNVLAPFEYTGQTAGSREVEVRARVSGILLSRNFAEGSVVKRGQSLFTIDPAPFEAVLARADADLAAAEARLAQSKRNAARLKPLLGDKAVSQKEVDDAASGEQVGEADVKAARTRVTEARLNLGYTRVESPITGVASRAQRSEGTLVSGPEVLLTTVTQMDPIWVNFGIPDNEQLRLRKEGEAGRLVMPAGGRFGVTLKLADGSVYERAGVLSFSDVRVSGQTGTSEARAEIPNPNGLLRPGQFVRVTLTGATRPNAILIPQRAVLEGPQGKFVYVVVEGEKGTLAQARPVEVGEWAGTDWIIIGGLKAGEKVIIDGVLKIGPGAPVKVADPNAPAPAGKPEAPKPAAEKK
jgi:membrane fusion protein (multidrug efflux system)